MIHKGLEEYRELETRYQKARRENLFMQETFGIRYEPVERDSTAEFKVTMNGKTLVQQMKMSQLDSNSATSLDAIRLTQIVASTKL